MNVETQRELPVWGFTEDELARWPADLRPQSVTEPPREGPVVVHLRAASQFQGQARPRADGRLPEAVLYLPPGASAPGDAWIYFDMTVQAGDWEALQRLALCPRQFEMAEWAQEVPAGRLEEALEALRGWEARGRERPAELPPTSGLAQVPPEARAHLARCGPCRQAFTRHLEQRLRLHWQLYCPPLERLAGHARGQADPWVEVHLAHCAACRGEMAAWRQLIQPASAVWLAISLLLQEARAVAAGLEAQVRQQAEGLAALVNGLLGAGLIPTGAWARRSEASGPLQLSELKDLLDHLRKGEPLTLIRPYRELKLCWMPEKDALCLEALRGKWGELLAAFTVELRRGEEVVWQAEAREGKLDLPLAALQEGLEAGADTLVILAPEKGGEEVGDVGP